MTSSEYAGSGSDLNKKTDVRPMRDFHVPYGYNDNKIVLMIRDPWTLYSYWEIRREVEDGLRREIQEKGLIASNSLLRVYDVTEASSDACLRSEFSFELKDQADSWYIHIGNHGKKWIVEVGISCTTGEFFVLARSNTVEAPFYGMSEIYDDEWMCSEELYYRMFAASGGYGIGTSSLQVKETLERHHKGWLFSGGMSSGVFGSAGLFPKEK